MKKTKIPVEVSAHHLHPSQKDIDILFGKNYELHKFKDLSQPGKFAAKEEVEITSPNLSFVRRGAIRLRILGPARAESQVELSMTECIALGLEPQIILSGNLAKAKNFLIVKGPKGKVKVKAIVAERHLHCSPEEAKKLKLKNGQKVCVEVLGERGLVFKNIIVRIDPAFKLSCHIDTDEANACGLGRVCGMGYLIQ